MKKMLALALSAALAAGTLAGCGGSGGSDSGATTQAAAQGGSAETKAEAKTEAKDVFWTFAAPPASSALYPYWVSVGQAVSTVFPQYKIDLSGLELCDGRVLRNS